MANTLNIKYSDTPGNVPTLTAGELATNRADKLLFYTDSGNAVKSSNLLNGVSWFNIVDYGALPAASAAMNTTAINAAITAAMAVKGTVYIPPGTYLVNTLNWNPVVSMVGDGLGSVLKSNSAVPLLSYTTLTIVASFAEIRDFTLDGNSIGTIGMNMYATVNFKLDNMVFKNFTSKCLNMSASLIGVINSCQFIGCPTGVYAIKGTTNLGVEAANLVTFNSCVFNALSSLAVDWNYGAGIMFNSCDFEVCGTSGNNATGVVKFSNMASSGEGVAAVFDKCWMESNYGTSVKINQPAVTGVADATYIIQNTLINLDYGAYGIYLDGNSIQPNKVLLLNSTIKSHTTFDLVADGASAVIKYTNTDFSTSSILNGGTIANTAISSLNPTSSIGLTVVNGTSLSFMRSDAAPALSQAIAPTWTALHIFNLLTAFLVSIRVPLIIGGTATTSNLILQPTSGVGTTDADIILRVGNNGGTEAMRILNNANVGVGLINPGLKFEVAANTAGLDGIKVANANSAGSGTVDVYNNTTNYAFLRNYGTTFALSYLQDATAFGAKNDINVFTDANSATGGTHSINLFTGGYNQAQIRIKINSSGFVGIGSNLNGTALLHIGAGSTSAAPLRLTVSPAPTSPNDGDIWLESNTNTGLKIRIAGVTKTISLT